MKNALDEIYRLKNIDYLRKSVIDRYSQNEEVAYWCSLNDLWIAEDELVKEYFIGERKKVLVLGCGGGRESLSLYKMNFDMIGLDLVLPMVKAAKKKCLNNSANVPFINSDAKDLPFKSYSFDFATMFGTAFPRIPTRKNRVKTLKEVRRVLKSGGLFIVSIYNLNFIANLLWFLKVSCREFRKIVQALKHNQPSNIRPILNNIAHNFNLWIKALIYAIYSLLISAKIKFFNMVTNNKQDIERGDVFLTHTSPTKNRIKAFFHFYNIKEIIHDITAAGLEVVTLRGVFEPKEELSLNNFLSLGDPAIYLVVKPR